MFFSLYRCPMLLDLDLVNFSRKFNDLRLPSCALLALRLILQSSVRDEETSKLLSNKNCVVEILDQVVTFKKSRKPLPMIDQVLHFLEEISSCGEIMSCICYGT